ncbi:NADH:flavin oxidoreductase/NADH oxidase [Arenibacterium halophilum]|nr:NADH:flavin oxidoreductase/NADH oxidase [Arenibacterium halophilum]
MTTAQDTMLFSPLRLRDVTFPNRIMLSPMCQYAAQDGIANDWHLVHLGGMANGGFGAIMTEAAAVVPEGRITHGDLGLWSDAHRDAFRPLVQFVQARGARFGIQLGHAGRKASMQRPWYGNGPLAQDDFDRGDMPWPIKAPSAQPVADGWLMPEELTTDEISALATAFADAARRADELGVDFIELHAAHGYLLHSFLSPLSNARQDAYGGSLKNRMRIVLEIVTALRTTWPDSKPLFVRLSSVDGAEGGWTIEDSIALGRALKPLGVDVIDCSSSGIGGATKVSRGGTIQPGYQLEYARAIREGTGLATQGVGMILDGPQAEAALQAGQADLIAVGRQALFDPFWPRHQAYEMGVNSFDDWPDAYGWWLKRREPSIQAARAAE